METLASLALYGLPTGGVLALGVWALRSLFQDVSIKDTSPDASKAEQRAEGLSFQLAVAEDLGVDAATLNHIKDQVELAQDDAERVRQTEQARQPQPATNPWLAPVAAVHNIAPRKRPDSPPEN